MLYQLSYFRILQPPRISTAQPLLKNRPTGVGEDGFEPPKV